MNKTEYAHALLEHLGFKAGRLPEYLMDDKHKRNILSDMDDRALAHYDEDSLWTLRTVRFLKDFKRYKAGVHVETTNKTFKRTAEQFQQMGVKNYYFLLQINNPLIKDLDPWDPTLTEEQKAMIFNECNENVWYILREVIKIGGRRFRGNRAVISFIWCCLNHIPTTILMPRQSGKAATLTSKIRMANTGSWKFMGDIEIGDKVLAPDGTETSVIGVYPQGKKEVFRLTFADGRTADCCEEHLWTVWDAGKGRHGKWRTLTTKEIIERNKELVGAKNHLSVPLPKPDLTQPHRDLPLNPYLLGVLLGDGSLVNRSINYTKPNDELANFVRGCLPAGHELSNHKDGMGHGIIQKDKGCKHIADILDEMGLLGKNSFTKFIPESYLDASHAQRTQLLQGLMDTDGCAEKGGNTYYCTSNETLAKQVMYLAHSLGHISRIKPEKKYYTYKGEKLPGAPSYRVIIRAQEPWTLFRTDVRLKNVENCLRGIKFNSKLAIYKVESLGYEEEMQCIEVDHPDHLYITDNFVVTHNTVGMQVLAFIMQYILGRGYRTGLITLAASNRMQFVEAIKKIRAGLPEYLTNMTYKDKDAGNILTYAGFGEENKNTFEVRVPSGGRDGAENVSRGATLEALLYDEPAWTKFIEEIINGSGPATMTAQKEAREKGIPYFTAKATTPNSVLKEEGKYMHDDFMESTEWKEIYFDSFSESHLVERLIKGAPVNTTFPKVGMMFTHLQLGFGHSWIKETMDKLSLSWGKAKIDLLMMWTEEGMNKLFDDFTREKLADSKVEHLRNEEILETDLFVDWFIPEETLDFYINNPDEFFLFGVDTSDANNRDACTLVIRRMKTGEVIGTGRYALAFLDDVTLILKDLLVRIPNSLLIIERNRAAHMIERLLIMLPALGIDPFKRIFNDIVNDPIKYKNEFKDVQDIHFRFRSKEFYLKYKGKFGFHTGPETRRQMYGFIHEAVSSTGAGARYKLLIDELIGLQIDKDGRIDHESKGHDDLVIAWLLTFWFIKIGYNKSFYDIPPGMALTELKTLRDAVDAPKYSQEQLRYFVRLKERINKLTQDLQNTYNPTLCARIEMDIRKLSEGIPKEMKKSITIDELIENAKSEKSKLAMERRSANGFSGRRVIV